MADEREEPQPSGEGTTPGRSLRGAARDLSSLFGEDAFEMERSSAIGPSRSAQPGGFGSGLEGIGRRMSYLESELAQAVSRIQVVDRHLAATYQALQGVLERLVTAPPEDQAATLVPVAERLEAIGKDMSNATHLIGDRIERLTRRLAAVEVAVSAASDRLSSLESVRGTGGGEAAVEGPSPGEAPQPDAGRNGDREEEPGAEEALDAERRPGPDGDGLDADLEPEPVAPSPAPFWTPPGGAT